MDENYVKATEIWIEQAKNQLEQSNENKRYLENRIQLEQKELDLINENIHFSKKWIEKTEKELKIYISNNSLN